MPADPGEQVCVSVVCRIVAGKSDQHHINDGQNGKRQDTDQRQRQHGLVELVVQERLEVLLTASDLLTLCGNVHADAALLDLQTPGVDKCDNKENGKKRVQHDLDRVITVNGDGGVAKQAGDYLGMGRNVTNGLAVLQEITLDQPFPTALCQKRGLLDGSAKPMTRAAGHEHIHAEHDLKQQKQRAAQGLTVIEITKSKDDVREFDRPVTLDKGFDNIHDLILDRQHDLLAKPEQLEDQAPEKAGNGTEEHGNVIKESLEFAKPQIFQIIQSFHDYLQIRAF